MATKKNDPGTLNVLLIAGVFLAIWNSGCTSHGAFGKVGDLGPSAKHPATPSSSPSPSPSASASGRPSLAGNWLCIDESCAPDTVKVISEDKHTILTTFTEHSEESLQTCRVQKTVTYTTKSGSLEEGTISADLSPAQVLVLDSQENTKDCQNFYANQNLTVQTMPDNVYIEYDADKDQIKIQGLVYRRISDQDLEALKAKHDETNMAHSSIAGDWVSKNSNSEELHQKISNDLLQLTTDSTLESPNGDQKCHIEEISSLEIVDNTDPNKIYANQVKESLNLIPDPKNTDKCAQILEDFKKNNFAAGVPESVVIERDGNQELIIQGKPFSRSTVKASS